MYETPANTTHLPNVCPLLGHRRSGDALHESVYLIDRQRKKWLPSDSCICAGAAKEIKMSPPNLGSFEKRKM